MSESQTIWNYTNCLAWRLNEEAVAWINADQLFDGFVQGMTRRMDLGKIRIVIENDEYTKK